MSTQDKIVEIINTHHDWRGERLKELRELINTASPQTTESIKWGAPVWTYNGLVCAISAFKDHVKINLL